MVSKNYLANKIIMQIELKPKAIKDLHALPKLEAMRIIDKLKLLENDLTGDIKRLTNFTPEFRLRVGNYRILFEIEGECIIVYRIMHRQKAYTKR
jgi:mRNA interferase RelE/StbE